MPVGDKNRQQRAQMEQNIKEQMLIPHGGEPQQILGNGQMAGAGDRQKFRDSLDQAQQKGR